MREGAHADAPKAVDRRGGRQDQATLAFLQALRLNPRDGQLWSELATSLFFAGEVSESAACYKAGLAAAPNHPTLLEEAARVSAWPHAPEEASRAATVQARDSQFEAVALPPGSYASRSRFT